MTGDPFSVNVWLLSRACFTPNVVSGVPSELSLNMMFPSLSASPVRGGRLDELTLTYPPITINPSLEILTVYPLS